MTNKNETKRFNTLHEVQAYIDSLDATDTTKVYTLDVRNAIDLPFKPVEKVKILLDKCVHYIYNNQEELNISLDDFITLIRIKEDLEND